MGFSNDILARIWLSQSEALTPRGERLLLERHGSYEAVRFSFDSEDRKLVGDKAYSELVRAGNELERILTLMEQTGVSVITPDSDAFPPALTFIPDPPKLLYIKGELPACACVAIVGSRHDTRYGRTQATHIARDLARAGVCVVSGLARGIDTAAHRGALEGGGRTVAFLGCGLDNIYPPENKELAAQIVSTGGALVSEYPLGAQPLPYHFPRRNRLISGLSDAVLLIEATRRSGTQSTINHALDQGRMVFALPGNVDSPGSELPLDLLKDGAEICVTASDILCQLKGQVIMERARADAALSAVDDKTDDPILKALEREEKTFEELLMETGMDATDLSASLTMLELEGTIEKRPGRAYARARSS